MKIVGQIVDLSVSRERPSPKYGMDGRMLGVIAPAQRALVEVRISADEYDMVGPFGSDPMSMNVILHPGTGCQWQTPGFQVTDRRGDNKGRDVQTLERERDSYRRALDEQKDELARLRKENEILKRTAGLRAERVIEAVKKGVPARMLNLDVDCGDDK